MADNLVGVYLHGSYVLGGYNPAVSDLDYLMVVMRPLTLHEKADLMHFTTEDLLPLAPAKGLEFHVLLLAHTRHFRQPMPFDFHFSEYHRAEYFRDPAAYIEGMQGTDPDLGAHLMVVQTHGRVLTGLPIQDVFAPVPPAAYWQSILYDIADAPRQVLNHPTYITLNLCRVLAYREDGAILSKQAGGEWGEDHLPKLYQPLASYALASYEGDEQLKDVDGAMLDHFGPHLLIRFAHECITAINDRQGTENSGETHAKTSPAD
ncbi:streptomycin 3'-adenylyltransferase [Schleiferilactobacillus shenzhenensis LY-73]|uniref:Spectinomycin 9-adenylyltransferase n=1 Tax=Schleiferilactobacillus shenzhenensis LY-73 TaxID=1231336 RepID=U4TT93_9LACO|nr:streptomycin 3'-adenylyltransferase [Schleiferilactobacillus shenzhenensis LY-73]